MALTDFAGQGWMGRRREQMRRRLLNNVSSPAPIGALGASKIPDRYGDRRLVGRSMQATLLVAGLMFAYWTVPSVANAPWDLVTPQEGARDKAAPHLPGPPDLPPPPEILLLRPDISQPIRNPVSIKAQFRAGPHTTINMGSCKATYGWLGIDITDRLLAHATKTPNALSAENVKIPLGSHKITISIADMSGKRGSRTFQFSVVR
jgi:hypothetical protein